MVLATTNNASITFTSSHVEQSLTIQSDDTEYFSFAPASAWMQVEDDACNGATEQYVKYLRGCTY